MARPFSARAGRPRSRGQALVEIAIILPVFLLILMILLDFGRVIYAQHTITQDAREAVRRGIVSTEDLGNDAAFLGRYQAIRDAAQVMAPAVPIGDTDIFGAPGLCTTPLPVDPTVVGTCFYPNGITAAISTVVVHIRVTVDFMTPGVSFLFPDGITVEATAEQLVQS